MTSLKARIDQDLKTALLGGDSQKVMTLRGVKSAVLNEEVAKNLRETGLNDEQVMQILMKEAKRRQESADLYAQGHDSARETAELAEKKIIEAYLPKQMPEDELLRLVQETIHSTGASGTQAIGQVIGNVKRKAGASADGATIARLVREQLEQA